MTSPLFRREALTHAQRRLEGQVLITATPMTRAMIAGALALVGSGAVFLMTVTYAPTLTAPGRFLSLATGSRGAEAEVFVPANAAVLIRPGQSVRLADAGSPVGSGGFSGVVVSVSPATVEPAPAATPGAASPGATVGVFVHLALGSNAEGAAPDAPIAARIQLGRARLYRLVAASLINRGGHP